MKKLYKQKKGKKLCGVCQGIGEYFNADPTLIRLAWIVACCCGVGIVAYIIAAIIMPEAPTGVDDNQNNNSGNEKW